MKKVNGKSFALGLTTAALLATVVCSAGAVYATKTVQAEYADIKITLDNAIIDCVDAEGNAVEPFIIDGTTYLPVRAVSNALGLEVSWDQETKTVELATPEDEKPIYITKSGARYHYDEHCNGGTYWEAPLKTALGMGLTPCDKCVNKIS